MAFALLAALLAARPGLGAPAPVSGVEFALKRGAQLSSNVDTVGGESCGGGKPGRLCLALRYVVYRDEAGEDVLSREDALRNLRRINEVWGRCNLAFQIESFEVVAPAEHGLAYRTQGLPELDDIRDAFGDENTLLVATTGPWSRKGSLGRNRANAWTAMPGNGPYGVVLEKSVARYGNIIAHELGHYLNLLHVSDAAELMNPVIYSDSTRITSEGCATARQTARTHWARMLR